MMGPFQDNGLTKAMEQAAAGDRGGEWNPDPLALLHPYLLLPPDSAAVRVSGVPCWGASENAATTRHTHTPHPPLLATAPGRQTA